MNGTSPNAAAIVSAAGASSGELEGCAHRQHHGALDAVIRRERHSALHRRRGAADDDLPRRIVVADHADLAAGGLLGDRGGLREIGADQRSHGAGAHRDRLLHDLAPQAEQARGVRQRQAPRSGKRGVFAKRMAGDEGSALLEPPGALGLERANHGDRDRHERGLRVPGERELALLTLEHEAGKALAEGLVDLLKHRAGGRKRIVKVAAHADRLGALTGEDDGRRHAGGFRPSASRSCARLLTMRPGTCQASAERCRSRVYGQALWRGSP